MSTDDNWDDDFDNRYSDEDRFNDQFDSRQQPRKPKQGMSSGMKVLIVLLCVGGGMFVLCCGGGIYVVVKVANSEKHTPEEVIAITNDIVDIEIPAGFKPRVPQGGLDLDMIFMQMKVVAYTPTDVDGILKIKEMNVFGANSEDQEPKMRRTMRQPMGNQDFGEKELILNKTEPRAFTIRGKEVNFKFAEAEDPDTGTAYRQVSGFFPGKEGTVLLMLQIEEEGYDEEAVVKMIESIK